MDLERLAFSYELCKIAQEKSKKRNYGAQMLAAAPVAVATSAADFPKGWVDKKVEVAVSKGLKPAVKAKAWKSGFGRASGRLGASVLTTPLFYSGIKDLKEGRQREGTAKVLAAGGAYSGIKGGLEAGIKNRGRGLTSTQIKDLAKKIGGTRGIIGLGSAAITARSIAKAQKKGKKLSWKDRVAVPALIGAGIGAPKGAIEKVVEDGAKKTLKSLKGPNAGKALRGIGGAAAGRAAAGVIGAVAISEAARMMTKKSSEYQPQPQLTAASSAGQLYASTRSQARGVSDQGLQSFLKQRPDPERTPSRRAVTYAVNDELRTRGLPVPREQVRHQTHPPMMKGTSIAHTAAAAAVIAAPSLVWELGISPMKAKEKDLVLQDALDQMSADRGLERINAGSSGDSIHFGKKPSAYYRGFDPSDLSGEAAELLSTHSEASPEAQAKARALAKKIKGGKVKGVVSASRASDLAHELGHATAGELRRKTIASPAARKAGEIARIPAVVIPLIVLDSASDRSFHTKEEIEAKAKFAERIGGVSLLLGAPLLAEEATATAKGLQYMKRMGASNRQLGRAAARLLAAGSTYAAPFATGALAAKILRSRPTREKGTPPSDRMRS